MLGCRYINNYYLSGDDRQKVMFYQNSVSSLQADDFCFPKAEALKKIKMEAIYLFTSNFRMNDTGNFSGGARVCDRNIRLTQEQGERIVEEIKKAQEDSRRKNS